ncbi:hypothetical protein [Silanimonas sp.]|uniref:hypothetical protein n=1 Tax=Silanimonas sp. TaxID=1929290 RepID=UPI0022C08C99|nr:hypothetical protein [Silanimonas sp.]MCZ8164284.1 hypothetical protein [Silanimonas sp.]
MIREGAARAAAVHLALSALLVGTFLALVISVWYPPPLLQGAGGMRLVLIVAAVDLVAGPLITLLVYKRGKPGMAFDLTVIALLQASALAYGLHTTWVSRPAYLVLSPYRATLVAANEVYPANAAASAPAWGAQPMLAVAPDDIEARQALLFEVVDGKPDVEYRPAYFQPLSGAALAEVHATAEPVAAEALRAAGLPEGAPGDVRRLPLITREQELEVWFSQREARVLAIRRP